MPYWSFNEYAGQRDLHEAGLLKKWKNRILGNKEDGTTNLATAHVQRHAGDAIEAGKHANSAIGHAANLAGSIATGNLVGAAGSIWGLISDAVTGGSKAYKAGKSALYVAEINKHMVALKKHLRTEEQLDEETADAILDAVFEVDTELFGDVSENAWATGTKRFAEGLIGGYHNISEKIFAAVMAQVIREWVEKMGGKTEGLQATIAKLRGEKKQKIDFLDEPEIQHAMAEFESPEPHTLLKADEPKNQEEALAMMPKLLGWPRLPADGDKGWTLYHGHNYGTLKNVQNSINWYSVQKLGIKKAMQYFKSTARLYLDMPWADSYVSVGYEGLPEWDAARKLWICKADSD